MPSQHLGSSERPAATAHLHSGGVPCTFFGNRLLICAKPKPWSSASALRNRKEDKKTCTTLLTLFQLLAPTMNYISPLNVPSSRMFHKIRRSFFPMQLEHLFFSFLAQKRFQTRRCIKRERKKYQLSLSRSETRKKEGHTHEESDTWTDGGDAAPIDRDGVG